MGFIPSIPHAAIPGGTLNSVGNSLTKTYDPNDLDLIDNAHKASLKVDQQSLFANRQVLGARRAAAIALAVPAH